MTALQDYVFVPHMEMDGFDTNNGVIIMIMAATNRPEILDPALLRTGLLPGLPPPREHSEDTARRIDASCVLVEAHVRSAPSPWKRGASSSRSRADCWRMRW